MYVSNKLLFEFHYRDACAAELDVFVVVRDDARDGVQVLADGLPKCSSTCAVQDTDARCVDQQSVVDEVGDSLQGFVGSHAPHVNLLPEVEMLLPDAVLCLSAYDYSLLCLAIFPSFGGGGGGFLQSLEVNDGSHHAKGDGGLLALDGRDGAHGSLAFDADSIANG